VQKKIKGGPFRASLDLIVPNDLGARRIVFSLALGNFAWGVPLPKVGRGQETSSGFYKDLM
jgi:hypothetical protein